MIGVWRLCVYSTRKSEGDCARAWSHASSLVRSGHNTLTCDTDTAVEALCAIPFLLHPIFERGLCFFRIARHCRPKRIASPKVTHQQNEKADDPAHEDYGNESNPAM